MATLRSIKNRIKATKNIQQITKAMQAVSAVKMRKAEQNAIAGRPYALTALEILKNVRAALDDELLSQNQLVNERKVERTCLAVITSDKGLAGAFNTNVIREAQRFIADSKVPVDVVAVGKRGREYFTRHGNNVIMSFIESGDFATLEETLPIATFLHDRFVNKECDEVVIIYTNFISVVKQAVVTRKILPVTVEALEDITRHIIPERGLYSGMPQAIDRNAGEEKKLDYKFEPSAQSILNTLIPALISVEILQSVLEANASEHSSRMVAMKSASDNASDLIGSLRIIFNKGRQAQITKELTEITAGAEALNN
jgi:F-type H+-transporting ATPase subunit gamma